jgi:hypothetical protein
MAGRPDEGRRNEIRVYLTDEELARLDAERGASSPRSAGCPSRSRVLREAWLRTLSA